MLFLLSNKVFHTNSKVLHILFSRHVVVQMGYLQESNGHAVGQWHIITMKLINTTHDKTGQWQETIYPDIQSSASTALSIYPPSVYLTIYRAVCIYLSIRLSIWLSIELSIPVYLSSCLSLSIYWAALSICLFLYLSSCLYLSIYLSSCPYLSIRLSFY